jgi:hypothetical protein
MVVWNLFHRESHHLYSFLYLFVKFINNCRSSAGKANNIVVHINVIVDKVRQNNNRTKFSSKKKDGKDPIIRTKTETIKHRDTTFLNNSLILRLQCFLQKYSLNPVAPKNHKNNAKYYSFQSKRDI